MDMEVRQVSTPDGISWYVEQFHPKANTSTSTSISTSTSTTSPQAPPEHLVLIPSGEGDCYSMRTVAGLLASQHNFTITTFDMPGFSRTTAPRSAITDVVPQLVAKQLTTLLDALKIPRASFWGSSSGGGAALALVALYPARVKCAIVHEVPTATPPFFAEWRARGVDDAFLVAQCQHFFRELFIEDANDGKRKWDALGPEYHKRLEANYVMWQRNLVGTWEPESGRLASEPENLKRRPVFWTVGKLSTRDWWGSNWTLAKAAGLQVNQTRLECLHFAYVTVPEQMVEWIVECVRSVKD